MSAALFKKKSVELHYIWSYEAKPNSFSIYAEYGIHTNLFRIAAAITSIF